MKKKMKTGHSLGVVSLAASPDGSTVASSALDSQIRVWDVATHETKVVIACPPAENWHVAFVPDSQGTSNTLAVAGGASRSVKLYDVSADGAETRERAALALPSDTHASAADTTNDTSDTTNAKFVQAVAVSRDGARVACGAADGTVAVFDVLRNTFLHRLEGHSAPVRCVAFSPDGKTLYTACDDGHCHAYDAQNKSLLDALPGHKGWVLGVACARDGFGVATCGADAAVKLWDVRSTTQEKCAQTASAQTEAVWGVAFSPSDDKLASASDDKSVAVYQYVP